MPPGDGLTYKQQIRIAALQAAAITVKDQDPDEVIAVAEKYKEWIGWGEPQDTFPIRSMDGTERVI